MGFGQLLLFHLMVGAGVALTVHMNAGPRPAGARAFLVVTAVFFWPLYVPILLTGRSPAAENARAGCGLSQPADPLARVIHQVDAELESALEGLDGWAEGVLAREQDRLHELRTAWTAQAERIRAMDRLLSRPEYAGECEAAVSGQGDGEISSRLRGSADAIRQNMARLKEVRQRTLDDLLGTLAWVRELASMVHLAKFTGAPASRAEELVAQIAAAVEGLSAISGGVQGGISTSPAALIRG